MRKAQHWLAVAVALVAATFGGAALAQRALIDQAKAECVIGEQADGYLGIVDASKADAALRREVDSINMQRKAAYGRLAERNGVTIDAAAKLTAEKLMNQAPSGHCIRDESGSWLRKP